MPFEVKKKKIFILKYYTLSSFYKKCFWSFVSAFQSRGFKRKNCT